MYRPASLITGILLIFIAVAQFLRAVVKAEVLVEGLEVPVWASWVAAAALALLGYSLLKERSRQD